MKNISYFFQYISIMFLFLIFKILGLKFSSIFSSFFFRIFGPLFRSNDTSDANIKRAFPKLKSKERKNMIRDMWKNYGIILAEYMYMKDFRKSNVANNKINIKNKYIIEDIIRNNKPVIFISGHFNNFELMAMQIESLGVQLATIYRPLNNYFLNPVMEKIREKYICKYQVKKGISGTKEILKFFKKGISMALMIDQRVSEGIKCKFFGVDAMTTTIPAQFSKRFNADIIPVYIERHNSNNFTLEFFKPIKPNDDESVFDITLKLNKILENMILKNPEQWIWTHNRWK